MLPVQEERHMARVVSGIAACMTLGLLADLSWCQDKSFTVLVKGNLTSESQIYVDLNSSDPIARTLTVSFTNFYGFGAEIRYNFPGSRIAIGVSSDYLSVHDDQPLRVASRGTIPSSDGYTVIPVEITGYFIIPASGRSLKISMGGGVGGYFGRRNYSVAGVEAKVINAKPGFGIHVLGGVSYFFTERLSASAEMKFRDVKFETTNAFEVSRIPYQGSFITVNPAPFESRVQTDGIVFQLGVGFSF
jgi:hypothetical protein